jgi:hypothetical protein
LEVNQKKKIVNNQLLQAILVKVEVCSQVVEPQKLKVKIQVYLEQTPMRAQAQMLHRELQQALVLLHQHSLSGIKLINKMGALNLLLVMQYRAKVKVCLLVWLLQQVLNKVILIHLDKNFKFQMPIRNQQVNSLVGLEQCLPKITLQPLKCLKVYLVKIINFKCLDLIILEAQEITEVLKLLLSHKLVQLKNPVKTMKLHLFLLLRKKEMALASDLPKIKKIKILLLLHLYH